MSGVSATSARTSSAYALPIFDLSERQLFDVNRVPVGGIAAGHPNEWTIEQLREPAQSIANKIEELMNPLRPRRPSHTIRNRFQRGIIPDPAPRYHTGADRTQRGDVIRISFDLWIGGSRRLPIIINIPRSRQSPKFVVGYEAEIV